MIGKAQHLEIMYVYYECMFHIFLLLGCVETSDLDGPLRPQMCMCSLEE